MGEQTRGDANPPTPPSQSEQDAAFDDATRNRRPLRPSSFKHDDHDNPSIIYSYFSTWSTNYTMSNLPGPGRILGNLFSKAGSSLERGLGKLAQNSLGKNCTEVENRIRVLGYILSQNLNPKSTHWQAEKEKEIVCRAFLSYARYVQFPPPRLIFDHSLTQSTIL